MKKRGKSNTGRQDFNFLEKLNTYSERQQRRVINRKTKKFKCNVCHYYFNSYGASLERHMRTHTGERPYKCHVDNCGMTFKQGPDLKRHFKYKHSDERPFKCNHPLCEKSFKSSKGLKAHFSYRHGERKFQCDHPGCGRSYGNVDSLNQHKKYNHSEKTHSCPERGCSYRTGNVRCLPSHMLIHRRRAEEIQCSIEGCEYKGKHWKAMKQHMHRHKTRLPCPAPGCGRHATTKEALKEHVQLHNPSGRPFQCPLCFKHFRKLYQLQRHCTAHTNEKPFRCGHCEYAAATKHTIKTHISLVHRNIKYPFIALHLTNRECLHCRVTLSFAEFIVHSMSHEVPVVLLERHELILS